MNNKTFFQILFINVHVAEDQFINWFTLTVVYSH